MSTHSAPSVVVLWDFDQCVPVDIDAKQAASIIQRVASPHGNVKKLRCYWNGRNPAPEGLNADRNAYLQTLQMQGIESKECSFLGSGEDDTVEKVMLIDMTIDAADGATPTRSASTVVVLSPSASVCHAAQLLRNRHFKVLLFKSWDELQGVSDTSPSASAGPASPLEETTPVVEPTIDLVLDVPPNVAHQFRSLIAVLGESMRKGKDRVSRADIGNLLKGHSPTVYSDAGFGTSKKAFSQYLSAAESAGVIIAGGGGTGSYVELNLGDQNDVGGELGASREAN